MLHEDPGLAIIIHHCISSSVTASASERALRSWVGSFGRSHGPCARGPCLRHQEAWATRPSDDAQFRKETRSGSCGSCHGHASRGRPSCPACTRCCSMEPCVDCQAASFIFRPSRCFLLICLRRNILGPFGHVVSVWSWVKISSDSV